MSITLYVDRLDPDKTIGTTTNHATMLENVKKLGYDNFQTPAELLGAVFEAGRYVGIVYTDKNQDIVLMLMDFHETPFKEALAAKEFGHESTRIALLETFQEVRKKYSAVKDLVELELRPDYVTVFSTN